MKLGEVLIWETDKAIGHALRTKYHVYICEEDGFDGHTFLFISSAFYDGDFPVSQADYPFLDHDSYVSLGRIVCYTTAELSGVTKQSVGAIKPEHLKALFNAVQGSPTMEAREIKRVCNALMPAL